MYWNMFSNRLLLCVVVVCTIGVLDFFQSLTVSAYLSWIFSIVVLMLRDSQKNKFTYFFSPRHPKKECTPKTSGALQSIEGLRSGKLAESDAKAVDKVSEDTLEDAVGAGGNRGVQTTGRIKSFDMGHMHGFIRVPGKPDVWFAGSDVETRRAIAVGAVVEFELYFGANNRKPRARMVKVIDEHLHEDPEVSKVMLGYVRKLYSMHCFIECDELADDVFVGREELSPWDWRCLQMGQPLQFCLVPQSPKPKSQHVQVVTEKTTGLVQDYFPSRRFGFIRIRDTTLDVWFAAASVQASVGDRVPAWLVPGAEVEVEFFSGRTGQLRAFHVRCDSA